MKQIDLYLDKYGESHQNKTNKMIHWLCVPAILFSLAGILMSIPFFMEKTWYVNWAGIILALALIFYLRLSISMFIGFVLVSFLLLYGNYALLIAVGSSLNLFYISIAIFIIAWIGQFIGHKIEGKKPSFLDDVKYLLIGPAWLMHFIYKKVGIPY
jgi:uncharacterized membrane protein YGL010W